MHNFSKLFAFALLALIVSVGIASAQDHAPTVPPDPDDGGCCPCGYWACLIGWCTNVPCVSATAKVPMIRPISANPTKTSVYEYSPMSPEPLTCPKAAPPPTNTTYPDDRVLDIPWLGIKKSK